MSKFYLLLLVLPFIFFTKPSVSHAFVVNSSTDSGGILESGSPYYHSGNDEIRIDFIGSSVVQTIHAFNPPTGTVRVNDAPAGTWFVGSGLTCVGTYDFTAKDANGTTLLSMSITVEEGDLVAPRCDSGSSPGDLPTDGEVCGTMVCECIEQLKQVLHGDLITVNNNLSDLKGINTQIKNEIISLHDEFQTNNDYVVKPMPDVSNLINANKPVQNTIPFEDGTNYFSDTGSAESPGKLPLTPEPKPWDGFTPDIAMPPESEKTKDGEFNAEPENIKDVFNRDTELIKDSFVADDVLIRDGVNQFTEDYTQNHFYDKTNVFP